MRVLCLIKDPASGVTIWPTGSEGANFVSATEGGYLVFPLSNAEYQSWESGNAYRYTMNISVPSGEKVDFEVTVDKYPEFTDISASN